jgi:hypothetical protein
MEIPVSLFCRTVVVVSMFALAGLLDLALGTGSFGADLPLVPRHHGIQYHPASSGASKADTEIKAGTEMRLEEFAKGSNAACTAWTDGCRSCGKGADGVLCSNVGIACQPSVPRCSRP